MSQIAGVARDAQRERMTTLEIANRLVTLCNQGKNKEAMDELYSKDIVSVEAGAAPGMSREARGEAVHAKAKWWSDNHTVHGAKHEGPWPHDNKFIVRFTYDVTQKASGKRFTMDEVGLFTVENGKIVREEFFYSTAG